jgi:putative acetyltransferase
MIRKYEHKDLNEVLDAWYSASQVAHPFLSQDFFEQERRDIGDLYLPKAETWVFELEGDVVGFISLMGNEVGGIFVHSAFQRKGIGRALMDHVRNLREELELDVFENNLVGRSFYEKYGFIQVGEHVHEETGLIQLRLKADFFGRFGESSRD